LSIAIFGVSPLSCLCSVNGEEDRRRGREKDFFGGFLKIIRVRIIHLV
jgi:hypothetical protein